jgi:hypothetical protein
MNTGLKPCRENQALKHNSMKQLSIKVLGLALVALLFQTACKKDPIEESTGQAITIENKTYSKATETWSNHNKSGVDYIIKSQVMFQTNSKLTIEPGTEIVFENGGSLVLNKSTLTAIGSASAHIVFRGQNDTPGFWKSIKFYGNTDNAMAFCDVLNAGAYTSGEFAIYGGGSVIVGNGLGDAALSLENCKIGTSSSYGIFLHDESKLNAFSGNSITNCNYVAYCDANALGQFNGAGNQVPDNVHNQIVCRGGEIHDKALWPALTASILFEDDTFIYNEVSIEPGAVLLFESNQAIVLKKGANSNTKLFAEGTPAKPIVFRGAVTQKGYWLGMLIESGVTRMSYCNLSDAGQLVGSNVPYNTPSGSIWIWNEFDGVTVSIQHCQITNGWSNGITIRQNTASSVTLSDNFFSGNTEADVRYW